MIASRRHWVIAILVGLYLYFLLPATAVLFYELYHLTGIGPIYWGYSAFKAGGYYFGVWEYQALACLLVSAAIVVLPALVSKLRRS
jgi:hypothetical protein